MPTPTPAHAGGAPVGGLTVIAFRNNHLVYALTWFALALMLAGAAWSCVRDRAPTAATGAERDERRCRTRLSHR